MNVFEGSRRIAKIAAGCWVLGFGIAALNMSPSASAIYTISGPGAVPMLAAVCPDDSAHEYLSDLKTKSGTRVYANLCFLPARADDGKLLVPYAKAAIFPNKAERWLLNEQFSPGVTEYTKRVAASFRLPVTDEPILDRRWWADLFQLVGAGFAWMLIGLAVLWILSLGVGWVVRGFMGIPLGQDNKPGA